MTARPIIDEGPPTIQERIARATRSNHLEHKDRPCDIDKIGALGMAGIDNAISSAVFRLKYSNDAKFYKPALGAVTEVSKRLGKRFGWLGSAAQFAALNKAALDFWLNDSCMSCEGRGYLTVLGTPFLSDDACTACYGSTRRPKPAMDTKEWDGRFNLLLSHIEQMERRAGSEVMARLSNEMSDFR